ncbi:hypothetical protein [Trinickia sp.]
MTGLTSGRRAMSATQAAPNCLPSSKVTAPPACTSGAAVVQ